MRTRTRRTLAATIVLTLAAATGALAAGPLKGKTYEGGVPSTGVKSEGHHQLQLRAGGNIVLGVSRNGKSVTVRFTSSSAVLYCRTPESLHSQSTKPASISRSGTFHAAIVQKYSAGSGSPAIVQVVSGHFSGHTVKGSIHTQAGECGGVSTFSARAR